jgi:hypothetical protein
MHYGGLDLVHLARFLPRWLEQARRQDAQDADAADAAEALDEIDKLDEPAGRLVDVSMLIRLVDDSLTVSTRQADAVGFLAAMQRGYPDYGCRSNPAKDRASWRGARPTRAAATAAAAAAAAAATAAATAAAAAATAAATAAAAAAAAPAGAGGEEARGGDLVHDGFGRAFFSWCGSLLNVASGEVQPDLRRRGRLHASGVRALGGQPLCVLLRRMSGALRPKLHRLYLDPQLNSGVTVRHTLPQPRAATHSYLLSPFYQVRRNVFLALLHAASFGLAFSRRVVALRNPDALIELLGDVIRFAASTAHSTQRRCATLPPEEMRGCSVLLETAEVVWLGWAAVEVLLWHRRSCPLTHTVWRRVRGLRRAADTAAAQPLAVDARGLVRHFCAVAE